MEYSYILNMLRINLPLDITVLKIGSNDPIIVKYIFDAINRSIHAMSISPVS